MDRRDFLKASAAATLTLAADTTWAQNAKTEIHWLGQATAKITTPSGKVTSSIHGSSTIRRRRLTIRTWTSSERST